MLSDWGSWELVLNCQKTSSSDVLVWRLVAWGVTPSDKGKPEKHATHGA